MADSSVVGIACESRGRRGPRGPAGPAGPSGPSGAAGITAYGYAVGIEDLTIDGDQDARFSSGGLDFPHVGLLVPDPGTAAFTVLSEGAYEYSFYVVGNSLNVTNEFGMYVDGVSAGDSHEFRSDTLNVADVNNAKVVRGSGIFQLDAGAVVTLRNRTGAGTRQVKLSASAPGAEVTANVTLSLKKLS